VKFDCPSCQATIHNKDVKARRKEGFVLQRQCPQCDAWLRLNPKMEAVKNTGLMTQLIIILLNFFSVIPEYKTELSVVGLVGMSLALLIILKAKREIV